MKLKYSLDATAKEKQCEDFSCAVVHQAPSTSKRGTVQEAQLARNEVSHYRR